MHPSAEVIAKVRRTGNWTFAAMVLILAAVISVFLYRTHPLPTNELEEVAGQLLEYKLDRSGKSGRIVQFSLAERPGQFWTQALAHDQVAQTFRDNPTRLRFFVQSPSTSSPMREHPVKTFGLWVNGLQVQSREADLKDENFQRSVLFGLNVLLYCLATGIFIYGYTSSRGHPSAAA